MKQTAVEWLIQALIMSEDNPNYNQWAIDKAKAMEEKQMCSFAEFIATYPDKNQNYLGEMLHAKSKYDGAERTVDLLKAFKSE